MDRLLAWRSPIGQGIKEKGFLLESRERENGGLEDVLENRGLDDVLKNHAGRSSFPQKDVCRDVQKPRMFLSTEPRDFSDFPELPYSKWTVGYND